MGKNTWTNTGEHAREPWEVKEVTGGAMSRKTKDLVIFDADGDYVVILATVRLHEDFSQRDKDNAARICACVNYCR